MNIKEQHDLAVRLKDGLDDMHNTLEGLRDDLEAYARNLEELMGENEL